MDRDRCRRPLGNYYFQEGLNDENNHPVDDLAAADRRVVASREIGIRRR